MTEKWEPSEEAVAIARDEFMRLRFLPEHLEEAQNDPVLMLTYTGSMRAALIAAVQADPLLRAAGEMQSALQEVFSYVGIDGWLDSHVSNAMACGITKQDLLRLRAALRHSRGEE